MTVNLIPVKSGEVRALMADLKGFAFEQNPGFRDGSQGGFEVRKNFFHRDNAPDTLHNSGHLERAMTTLQFSADRLDIGKSAYSFNLHMAVKRTLPVFPEHLLPIMPPKLLRKHDGFKKVMRNALHECMSTDILISDDALEDLEYREVYTLRYLGKKLHRNNTERILDADGDFVNVPGLECDNIDQQQLWVKDPVLQERLELSESLQVTPQFWDTVTPLEKTMERDGFRNAAAAARAIISSLRTGILE